MTAEAKPTIKQLIFSPLKRWRHEHCSCCGDQCRPCEERFLVCVLCDLTTQIGRDNELFERCTNHEQKEV